MLISYRKFESQCFSFALRRYLDLRRNTPGGYDPEELTRFNMAAIGIHRDGGIIQPDVIEMISFPLNVVMEEIVLEQMDRIPQFVPIPDWCREKSAQYRDDVRYDLNDFSRVTTTQWMFALRGLLEIGGPLGAPRIYSVFKEALHKHKQFPEYRAILSRYLWPDYSWMLGRRGKEFLGHIVDGPSLDLRNLEKPRE